MHRPEVRAAALDLIAQGLNDCEVSRRLGVPRRTILDWRRPSYVRRTNAEVCPRCWRPAKPMRFTAEDYSELLAMYLGDGCISTALARLGCASHSIRAIRESSMTPTHCLRDVSPITRLAK